MIVRAVQTNNKKVTTKYCVQSH